MEIYGAFFILFLFHPFSFSFCSLAPLALRSRDDLRYLRKRLCGETSTKKGMLEEALKDLVDKIALRNTQVQNPKWINMFQNVNQTQKKDGKEQRNWKELEGTGRTLVFDIF